MANATVTVTDTSGSVNLGYLVVNSGSYTADKVTVKGGSGTTLSLSDTSTIIGVSPSSFAITSSTQVNTPAFQFLSVGAATATVTATDTASVKITLTGTGVAPAASAPTALSLGDVLVNYSSSTATLTVSNTGNGNLASGSTGNLIGTIGAGSSVFSGTAKPFTLNDTHYTSANGTAYGTTSSVTYTFTPTASGVLSTVVTTTLANGSNSANAPGTLLTTLTGTGVAPVGAISTSSANYFLVGTGGNATLTVSNTGNGNLSGAGTVSNLRGSIAAVTGTGFTGAAVSISQGDSSSATYTYSYNPTAKGATASTLVVASLSNGAVTTNLGSTQTLTLTGTGVAPVAALSSSSTQYVLVGNSATASVTLKNTGDGNLSGLGSASNLNGFVSSPSTGFSGTNGTGGQISQGDGVSSSWGGTFTPTVKGATASVAYTAALTNGNATGNNAATTLTASLSSTGVAPVQSTSTISGTTYARVGTSVTTNVATIANIGNGNLAGTGTAFNLNGSVSGTFGTGVTGSLTSFSLADPTQTINPTSTTLAVTYTPISRGTVSSTALINFSNGNALGTNATDSVSSVFINQGVGPVYTSSVSGSGATDTPTAIAKGSIGAASSTISFGTVGYKKSTTIYLALENTTTDPGAASLTNLTIESYSIAGANAGSYSISLSPNQAIAEGSELLVPITVTNLFGAGVLNSSLTIFTDESAALGGVGDTFTYALTALAVPEPTTLALLGVGLAGLAGLRRRRR